MDWDEQEEVSSIPGLGSVANFMGNVSGVFGIFPSKLLLRLFRIGLAYNLFHVLGSDLN